jgi:hypothetical protein
LAFFHDNSGDVEQIAQYITNNDLRLFVLDVLGKETPQLASLEALNTAYQESMRLWGAHPDHYFLITKHRQIGPMMLHEAVEHAKSGSNGTLVVLLAYNDGGMISASKEKLSFQGDARDWTDWRPIDFSKPPKLFSWLDKVRSSLSRRP